MSNFKTELLFQLIKSLTKAEKRSFKLYAKRTRSSEESKFITLFDALEKMEEYDEEQLLRKFPEIKKTQLSNLKANLYRQILTSLRLVQQSHNDDIQIRESIDNARILYNKGLYKHSLQILERAKAQAMNIEHNTLVLEILEFEKMIEAQYITRSLSTRSEDLIRQVNHYRDTVALENDLSNLSLSLFALYLQVGYVRNEKDYLLVNRFMKTNKPELNAEELSFGEKYHYFQTYVWYHHILQDFLMCYRFADKQVTLFEQNPVMKEKRPNDYIKSLHSLLSALYHLGHYNKFCQTLQVLNQFGAENQTANRNTQILLFLYGYLHRINRHFMEGTFNEGLELVDEIERKLKEYELHLDPHRVMSFYYKIGCLYFGKGDFAMASKYLERIIKMRDVSLRTDLQGFSRILNLISYYESGDDEKLEYQIKSVYHFLGQMQDLQAIQKEIFAFLRKLGKITPTSFKQELIELRKRIVEHSKNPYERRPLFYLDIVSWLESKIENRPVQEVVRDKFIAHQKTGRMSTTVFPGE